MSDRSVFDGNSFLDRFARGEVTEDQIDDFIDDWHAGKTDADDLHEYLGLTWGEYAEWVKHDDALPLIVQARREGRPVEWRPALEGHEQPV